MGSGNKYLRGGLAVICGALMLRLVSGGALASFVTHPDVMPVLLFLETGRYGQTVTQVLPETTSPSTEPSLPTEPQPTQPEATVPQPTEGERTVVSVETYADCDGSGHGVKVITYSDGTQEEVYF